MNNYPLVSIIVPVYGVEKYLPKCLDSIIAQTYHNIELMLIDDGSPDRCGEICDEYAAKDKRIHVIHKQNAGVNEARITGFKESRGEYITFVDSDDYISPLYVERLYEPFRNMDVAMSCVQRIYVKKGKEYLDVRPVAGYFDRNGIEKILKSDFLYSYIEKTNAYNLGLCCKMIKREYLEGAMENARGLWVGEDLITNLFLIYRVPSICILKEYLYYYIQHPTQSTRNGSLEAWTNQVEQWNRIVSLDEKDFLAGQIPYRILMLTKLYVRNNVEQDDIGVEVFINNMDCALRFDIVKEKFVDYNYPHLSLADGLFVFLIRNRAFYPLYYLTKMALPLFKLKKYLKIK